jgi:hypothetical protein
VRAVRKQASTGVERMGLGAHSRPLYRTRRGPREVQAYPHIKTCWGCCASSARGHDLSRISHDLGIVDTLRRVGLRGNRADPVSDVDC